MAVEDWSGLSKAIAVLAAVAVLSFGLCAVNVPGAVGGRTAASNITAVCSVVTVVCLVGIVVVAIVRAVRQRNG